MDTHENARLTPRGREEMVRGVVDGAGPVCARCYKPLRKRRQMGPALPRVRCRWFARPILATAFLAEPRDCRLCCRRGLSR